MEAYYNMDTWTLNNKLEEVVKEVGLLGKRLSHIEGYLKSATKKNKVKDEALPDKKGKSPSVRTRRSAAKKS